VATKEARHAEDFAQDLNPKLGAEIAAEQRPTSLGLFGTPAGPVAWHALSRAWFGSGFLGRSAVRWAHRA
jgi:hypothetical protein